MNPKDELLLQLYACASQPAHWRLALDQLCAETGACSAVVQTFELGTEGVRLGWQVSDSRTERNRPIDCPQVTGEHNPRLQSHRFNRGLNRVVRDDELFDRHDPGWAALQADLARIGLGEFMGTLQTLPDGRLLGIALHRPWGDPVPFDRRSEQRLASLAPHLGQACELGQQLLSARTEMQRQQQHADMLRCALIACDAHGRVQWMNHSAMRLTRAERGLASRGGLLRAASPGLTARLHEEIAAAAHDECRNVHYSVIDHGHGALHLALRASARDAQGASSVMLAVTSAQDLVEVPADIWAKLLGLTLAEARLVATLAQGDTVELHAAQRGIALGTARNQLKMALAKTGTSRQADLVRVALSSAAAQVLG